MANKDIDYDPFEWEDVERAKPSEPERKSAPIRTPGRDPAQPRRNRSNSPALGMLNTMVGHAATIANHANILNSASEGTRAKVKASLANLTVSLNGASNHLSNKKNQAKGNAPLLDHLKKAVGEASHVANTIASNNPNSISHHEAQTALTSLISAHNELTKHIAEHG